jgi:hypothetical protein
MIVFQGKRDIALVGMSIALFIRIIFAVMESGIESCQTGRTSISAMFGSVTTPTADPRVKASLALLFAIIHELYISRLAPCF